MKQQQETEAARDLMSSFAHATGLAPGAAQPRRYLWTDAFAVTNLLELYRRTGQGEFLTSALRLIDQVHETLGRHRGDDPRTGWISGLGEEEGASHPTRGGLRIGKVENERGPDEPYDQMREWDRDGQYFHYLTRWMHALQRASRASEDSIYLDWAVELASAAFAGFVHTTSPGGKRLHWKMSIDLSRPLVTSSGQHDALDGLLTYLELQCASPFHNVLELEILELWPMCEGVELATADPLGLGGLLCDAYKLAQLVATGEVEEAGLLRTVLRSSVIGLAAISQQRMLMGSAEERLAFRELGLSIGLQALARLRELWKREPERLGKLTAAGSHLAELVRFAPETDRIRRFWLDPLNRSTRAWRAHSDINTVMLATSLVPDGYLGC